jgi:hypothetical protein
VSAYLPNPRVSCVLAEQVARALVNKGVALGALDRSAEAIAVYDDLLARFGTATELPLREWVAKAELRRRRGLPHIRIERLSLQFN